MRSKLHLGIILTGLFSFTVSQVSRPLCFFNCSLWDSSSCCCCRHVSVNPQGNNKMLSLPKSAFIHLFFATVTHFRAVLLFLLYVSMLNHCGSNRRVKPNSSVSVSHLWISRPNRFIALSTGNMLSRPCSVNITFSYRWRCKVEYTLHDQWDRIHVSCQ